MSPIDALLSRVSMPKVSAPGLTEPELMTLIKAGLRACDHGRLRPFRFILLEGDARIRLGEAMSDYLHGDLVDVSEAAIEAAKNKALRAPTLLSVIFSPKDNDKIPESEQLVSAGCAAQMIVTAAHLMGLGAMWRTGNVAYSGEVSQVLGLEEHEQVVAMIYLGRPAIETPKPPELDPLAFLTRL
ncbi:MAG: nitroreductase [Gammaproteobacteria bacterium]|nr:nitroreductase [Gammaproteobacteria bacterium]